MVNADPTADPFASETANSLNETFYLEIHIPTQYGYYTQDALLVHLDAFNKYGTGFGRGTKNPADKYKWKNLAPDTGNNDVGAVDFTLTSGNSVMPILDKRSIYFGGTAYAVSNSALDFSGFPAVTVEVVFKEANENLGGMLFEYSTDWNHVAGGFGAYLNTLSSGATTYDIVHPNSAFNGSTQDSPRNYAWNDSNQIVQTHTNVYSVIADADGRQVYIDGEKKTLIPTGTYTGTASGATTAGNFGSGNKFFVASRNGGSNFIGDIYCVRIYGKKLTQEEIAHNYKTDLLRYQDREFG
jgi:hypothetical protein